MQQMCILLIEDLKPVRSLLDKYSAEFTIDHTCKNLGQTEQAANREVSVLVSGDLPAIRLDLDLILLSQISSCDRNRRHQAEKAKRRA